MRQLWLVVGLALAACDAAPSSQATATPAPSAPAAAAPMPAVEDVTLDVTQRPLGEVVGLIQPATRVNLLVAKDAAQIPVTVKLTAVPWREALTVVARDAKVQVEEETPHVLRIERQPTVNFDFKNADIRAVIAAISDIAAVDIVVASEVEGVVTIKCEDLPWRAALESIAESKGFKVTKDARGVVHVGK